MSLKEQVQEIDRHIENLENMREELFKRLDKESA